jgi:tRNA threonylcarbamoyladenosine modification (KEOPS) complex Cgi121 subunit
MGGGIFIAGFVGKIDDAEDFVSTLRALGARLGGYIEAYDADAVLGAEHLAVAWEMATRARANGRAISSSLAMEARLHASCESQIKGALARTGVKPGVESRIAMVSTKSGLLDAAGEGLCLRRDDSVLTATGEKLAAWGIAAARGVATDDLIFERMALAEAER